MTSLAPTCQNVSDVRTNLDETPHHHENVVHADHADADPRDDADIIALLMYLIG
jgi:hypothetical protein